MDKFQLGVPNVLPISTFPFTVPNPKLLVEALLDNPRIIDMSEKPFSSTALDCFSTKLASYQHQPNAKNRLKKYSKLLELC
jgi:hypothetical protein